MKFLLFAISSVLCGNFFDKSSRVVSLTTANFDKKVLKHEGVSIVGFFADYCGHCKSFKPEFEKAAKALKGIVQIGAVFQEEQQLMAKYEIKGFPTVKVFLPDSPTPVVYQGARTAQALVDFAMAKVRSVTKSRMSGKAEGKKSEGAKKDKSKRSSSVVKLTEANFEKEVGKDLESVWFVAFVSPYCGHCKAMEGAWEAAAKTLKAQGVKVGRIDATAENNLAQRFGVRGYPTVKLFPVGKKSEATAVAYEAERNEEAFVDFAMKYYRKTEKAEQLISDAQYKEKCVDTKKACVIAILPHLIDSGATGRKKFVDALNEGIRGSDTPVKYFWQQAGDQMGMEEKLNLFAGYPALIVVHAEKGVFGVHRGTFQPDSIRTFLIGLTTGGVPMNDLPKDMSALNTVTPWDGSEYKDEL